MARLEALQHVTHNKVAVAVGEQFECDADSAKVLIELGAAKEVAKAQPETTAPKPAATQSKAPETKKKAAQAK